MTAGIAYCTIFGWMKEGFNWDNIKDGFDKYGKELAKHNVELLFYSTVFGVTEPWMYVQKFDDIHDWEKGGREGVLDFCPIERTRTILGWTQNK